MGNEIAQFLINMERRKKISKFKFKFKIKESILFTLLWVISIFNFVGSSVSDIHALQCFAKISSFHHHVSFGHMGLEIRFADFRQDLNDVNKRLVSYNSSGQGLYVKSTSSRRFSFRLSTGRVRESFLCSTLSGPETSRCGYYGRRPLC